MNINELLKGVDCGCGTHHTCDIQYVYIEKNAAARLKSICKDFQNILLVCDENTYAASGKQEEEALSGCSTAKDIKDRYSVLWLNCHLQR